MKGGDAEAWTVELVTRFQLPFGVSEDIGPENGGITVYPYPWEVVTEVYTFVIVDEGWTVFTAPGSVVTDAYTFVAVDEVVTVYS